MPTTPAAKPKSPKSVKVTFSLPAEIDAGEVALCGEFNDWASNGVKLARDKSGLWQTTIRLVPGRTYRYRYLLDGHRWENAWDADGYVPNPYGGDDSLIVVG
jgi:1,4-alpha-glucan branching enzyme